LIRKYVKFFEEFDKKKLGVNKIIKITLAYLIDDGYKVVTKKKQRFT
jgi:hypothetical protein